jgi:hypothetical protein
VLPERRFDNIGATVERIIISISNEREKMEQIQKVTVIDFEMSFWRMVTFMVKWAFAAIPAAIILVITWTIITLVFGGILFHH